MLINWIPLMVRQAHHERNQKVAVHPELVEGFNQRFHRFIRETVGCAMRTIERGMVRMAHPTAQPAIADLSGQINHEQGEVVCIVGHNDAGKSKVDQSSGRHT